MAVVEGGKTGVTEGGDKEADGTEGRGRGNKLDEDEKMKAAERWR